MYGELHTPPILLSKEGLKLLNQYMSGFVIIGVMVLELLSHKYCRLYLCFSLIAQLHSLMKWPGSYITSSA